MTLCRKAQYVIICKNKKGGNECEELLPYYKAGIKEM